MLHLNELCIIYFFLLVKIDFILYYLLYNLCRMCITSNLFEILVLSWMNSVLWEWVCTNNEWKNPKFPKINLRINKTIESRFWTVMQCAQIPNLCTLMRWSYLFLFSIIKHVKIKRPLNEEAFKSWTLLLCKLISEKVAWNFKNNQNQISFWFDFVYKHKQGCLNNMLGNNIFYLHFDRL